MLELSGLHRRWTRCALIQSSQREKFATQVGMRQSMTYYYVRNQEERAKMQDLGKRLQSVVFIG
jgi:hypothetical protein